MSTNPKLQCTLEATMQPFVEIFLTHDTQRVFFLLFTEILHDQLKRGAQIIIIVYLLSTNTVMFLLLCMLFYTIISSKKILTC